MHYILGESGGKDSLYTYHGLIERNYPLDEVVFYDTSMEFQAVYDIQAEVKADCDRRGIQYTRMEPEYDFLWKMFDKPVCEQENWKCRNCNHFIGDWCQNQNSKYYHQEKLPPKFCRMIDIKQYDHNGYSWCGGTCRWGTTDKLEAMDKYAQEKSAKVYIGIASDENNRIEKERKGYKIMPLVDWGKTEADCLAECYKLGYTWHEHGIDDNGSPSTVRLYDILDRVSCWCCSNKNLKELKNIFRYLPKYWKKLKDLQRRNERPMKGFYDPDTKLVPRGIFELEEQFKFEIALEKIGIKEKRTGQLMLI